MQGGKRRCSKQEWGHRPNRALEAEQPLHQNRVLVVVLALAEDDATKTISKRKLPNYDKRDLIGAGAKGQRSRGIQGLRVGHA